MANKENRCKKRTRVVVMFKPFHDEAAVKSPRPVLIARGHFESPDELTAKCQEGMAILPPQYQQKGTVLVGRESDEHITFEQFARKGHTWSASLGLSITDFIRKHCNLERFFSGTQVSG